MTALGHWAARQGARYAYLQVATVNRAGHCRVHSGLGFIPSPRATAILSCLALSDGAHRSPLLRTQRTLRFLTGDPVGRRIAPAGSSPGVTTEPFW